MSVTGLSTRGIPNSLTGLETINASYNAKFVPYVGAATTVNLGAQNITTTHQATNSFDLVNLQVLTNAIDFVNTANALTYLNKVTSDAQTVNSNQVSFQGAISASSVGVNGSYLFNKTGPFSHGWVIDRMIGTGSILKDLVFRDAETSVDCLKLSEDGQIIYVGLTCDYATANKVPIFNADKKLVSSGVDAIKITYLDNVSSDIQTQLNGKVPLVGPAQLSNTFEFTSPVPINLSGLTASRVLQLDASKNVQVSSVTTTELGYVSGVTSAIQTQLNGKVPLVGPAQLSNTFEFTSPVPMTLSGLTASRVLQLGASNNVQVSAVTTTELGYVSGVTSAIQTQLNTLSGTFANYLPLTGGTLSGSLTANGSITTKGSFYMWDTTTNARLQVDTGAGAYVIFEGYKNADYATKYPLLLQPNGGSVGIGTTVVLALFNINYDGGQDFLTLQNAKYLDGQYINIRFMFGKNNTTQASAYIQAYLNSSLATALRFFTDDGSGSGVAERARLTGDGYFGIGTVAPDVELNVVGKAKIHNGTVGAPANGTNGGNGTRLVLWPGNAGSCPYALGIDGGTLWYGTPTSATHKWYNGTTNVMALDGNGNMYRSNYVPYLFTNMFVSTSGSNGSLAVCAGNENDNAILYLGTPYSPTVSSGSAYKVAIIADGNGSGTGWSTADLHFCLNGTTGSNDWTQSAGLSHSRMVIKSSNYYVGIGTASPVGQLDIYNTGADYTNSLVVRTPWAGITMDNTQVGGGRKWHIFSGGPSAGIGVGNFGIYDSLANAYRFSINSAGDVNVSNNFTANQVFTNNWFRVYDNYSGLYWQNLGRGICSPEGAANTYGNISTYGTGRNGWSGYGINDRWVFMSNGPDYCGMYNTSNGWSLLQKGTIGLFLNSIARASALEWDRFVIWRTYENDWGGGYWYFNLGGGSGYTSDIRIKKEIAPLSTSQSIAFIKHVQPSTFRMKDTEPYCRTNPDGSEVMEEAKGCNCFLQDGFIAQNILEACDLSGVSKSVLNNWSGYEEMMKKPEEERKLDKDNILGVCDRPILSHTVNAVKGLMEQIDALTTINEAQNQKLEMLQQQVAALTAILQSRSG